MSGGHQIMKTREGTHGVPEWASSDEKIREFLLRSFPSLRTNQTHRQRAGRWFRIIHLYFRLGWTHNQVAEELGLEPEHIHTLIRAIRRAGNGKHANGTGQVSTRPRGRPRKISAPEP